MNISSNPCAKDVSPVATRQEGRLGSLLRKAQVKIGVLVFWEPPGKYIFFQATGLLILGVFKLMEMNVATAVFQVDKNWDLDVFGRCIFWEVNFEPPVTNTTYSRFNPNNHWILKGCPVLRLLHDPSKTPAYIFLTISHRHRIAVWGLLYLLERQVSYFLRQLYPQNQQLLP